MESENFQTDSSVHDANDASKSFDRILNAVGPDGKYQWRVFFIASFCGIFVGAQSLSAAFLGASPDYLCIPPSSTSDSQNITETLNVWSSDPLIRSQLPKCGYLNLNYSKFLSDEGNLSVFSNIENLKLKDCSSWSYDDSTYKTTTVTEWNLVCDREWLVPTIQSSFMVGVLIGAVVLSELSDMYGRRTIAVISAFGMFFTSVGSAFSFNLTMFLILKFCVAFFVSGLFLPNFVLVMEMLGTGCRTTMGVLYQFFFAVGIVILSGVAYFVRDWRSLQLAISVPSVILMAYIWILPESPRWLMLQGRGEEALMILHKLAKTNGGKLPDDAEILKLFSSIQTNRKRSEGIVGKISEFFKSQAILLRTPIMRRRCLIIFFAWFTVSMVYYGLAFSGGNIDVSAYMMVFLSGAVEMPALVSSTWTVNRFGRRLNLTTCLYTCGVACILILIVPKEMVWLNITLASIGKFFDAIAFSIVYIYSAELVPTGVRNIAVGTSSMCARIGSTIAPYIVASLGKIHYAIPSTIFGVVSIIAGSLILLLPETGKLPLPETIKEVENMKK